jgi:hypothetical protein
MPRLRLSKSDQFCVLFINSLPTTVIYLSDIVVFRIISRPTPKYRVKVNSSIPLFLYSSIPLFFNLPSLFKKEDTLLYRIICTKQTERQIHAYKVYRGEGVGRRSRDSRTNHIEVNTRWNKQEETNRHAHEKQSVGVFKAVWRGECSELWPG